jgi:hypothetical protein
LQTVRFIFKCSHYAKNGIFRASWFNAFLTANPEDVHARTQ